MQYSGRHIAALTLAGLLALAASACNQKTPVLTTRFNAFDSQVDLSLVQVSRPRAEAAAATIRADFEHMDQAWRAWAPGPMGRVNLLLPKGEPFVAPPSVLPLIALASRFWEETGGLVNPALGNLVELWGFDAEIPECKPPPPPRAIEQLLAAAPGMSDVEVDGLMIRGTNPALKLDFGGIAKGYAIDLAVEHLRELGVKDALVQVGPDLRAIGDRGGRPWRVAIRRPSGAGVLAILPVSGDESVANAAAYERNFVYDRVSYHHILDPRTGYPAEGSLAVTVAHTDAVTADAAATALFVAGPEHWHALARRLGVRYVLLVDARGTIHMSPAMHERIELVDADAAVVVSPPLDPAPMAAPSAAADESPPGPGG